jgi:hypothetical protein
MIKVINTKNNPCMSILDNMQLNTLDQAIKTVDPNVAIHTVNYDTGLIYISITYNRGTKDQWTNERFMEINVASDSVPAIFYDVFTRVYDRCI